MLVATARSPVARTVRIDGAIVVMRPKELYDRSTVRRAALFEWDDDNLYMHARAHRAFSQKEGNVMSRGFGDREGMTGMRKVTHKYYSKIQIIQ